MSYQSVKPTGTATIAGNSTVTLVTKTRAAGEILIPAYFLSDNVSNASFGGLSGSLSSDSVTIGFIKTGVTANEYALTARNNNLLNSRTIDWGIVSLPM